MSAAPSPLSPPQRPQNPPRPPAPPVQPPRWPAAAPHEIAGTLSPGEVHAWWLDLAGPAWPEPLLAGWLDADERQRAARFHFEVHRRRHVAAHGQMRAVLAAYAGKAPEALRFAREARGKPHLAADLTFNLSHSEDQALLAITRKAEIGADLEVARPIDDLAALARSHFGAAEWRQWLALPEPLQLDGFLAAWTRKEAYVKALGAGLVIPLDSFEVSLHPDRPAALRSIEGSAERAREWTLWAGRPTEGTWAAVAVHLRNATVHTFTLRRPDLDATS